jgi:hypothetical protein
MTMEDRFENFEAALPLSPEQRAVLAMHGSDAMQPLAVSAEIEGAFDEARLRGVAAGVLQAHESLRLAVREAADPLAWRQQPRATLPAGHAQAEAPMLPHEGGMVRIGLERIGVARHRLTLCAHPLAADAASLSALLARIAEGCGGAGAPEVEPAEPFQYTQFAAWRDALAHDDEEDAVQGRAYWAGYMAGAEPIAAPRPHCDRTMQRPNLRHAARPCAPSMRSCWRASTHWPFRTACRPPTCCRPHGGHCSRG